MNFDIKLRLAPLAVILLTSCASSSTSDVATQPPETVTKPSNTAFQSSSVEINYKTLKKLLAAKKWQEAHQETRDLMIQAGGAEEKGYLDKENIANFPCQDLNQIDQLWSKYSDGKFGFTTQRQIWENMGGNPSSKDSTLEKLSVQVGWKKENASKHDFFEYSQLNFEPTTAPTGHLPALRFIPSIFHAEKPGYASWGQVPEFMYRVRTCRKE